MKKREWRIDAMMTETFLCSMLIATGCFHGSDFGLDLKQKFKHGEKLEVIVRPARKRRPNESAR